MKRSVQASVVTWRRCRSSFDPDQVSYEKLLRIFWEHVDPTDPDGQFVDRGSQYRTAIFYHSEEQRTTAESSQK
jgi:peptide methionine sulfoxide reductase MsrA